MTSACCLCYSLHTLSLIDYSHAHWSAFPLADHWDTSLGSRRLPSVQFSRKASSCLNTWPTSSLWIDSTFYLLPSVLILLKIFRSFFWHTHIQTIQEPTLGIILNTDAAQCHTKHSTAALPWDSNATHNLTFKDLIQDRTQTSKKSQIFSTSCIFSQQIFTAL